MLSAFGLSESYYQNGNIKNMISTYKTIYDDIKFDDHYRNLAILLSVMRDNISEFNELHERLMPLLKSPSKLQKLAAELEIILFIRYNKMTLAEQAFTKIMVRKNISLEQKNRLGLISEMYGFNE